ncbi:alpha/beta fold hydrolase [Hymenobacter sp. ISL-91]|uniref:alpha/beta hydrolase n=1 Tax=Hymenobacter sp. ISL-91 TaxID=2819151 RepID=UPI001BE95356|nr:alpha/beta fold hydrolase [Hymenobacter sp. ISL-91]MBT2556297.1 alpha/beta fold hydrolase [Hymenobacter sp. ISL-91]
MKQCLLIVLSLVLSLPVYALRPSRIYTYTPDSLGLAYRAVRIETPDHFQLASWIIEPQGSRDQHVTIVIAEGDAGNMGQLLFHAKMLADVGYRVVLFDYRGFGHSSDFAIDQQRLYYTEFAVDLRAALLYSRQQFPQSRTGIFGFSMGTIMATHVAATEQPDFLIGEGYVADPVALVAAIKQVKNKTVTLPSEAAMYSALLAQIQCPMLLVAGTKDTNTPLADSRRIVQAAHHRRRKLISFEGAHGEGLMALSSKPEQYGDLYAAAIHAFLVRK